MYPLCPTEAALVCMFSGAGSGVKVSKVGESYAAMVKKDPLEVGEAWIQIGGVRGGGWMLSARWSPYIVA